jgi:RNA polymerase sigma factor (sigma-70 family)
MSIVHAKGLSGASEFGCAQAGCRVCQERLVRQHEGLVHYVLRRQVLDELSYAELVQVGRIGLWQAVRHFDAGRGIAFSTYAVVAIRHHIWRATCQARRTAAQALPADPIVVWREAEEQVWQSQVEAALQEAVGRLPTRPRQVIIAAYGLDGQPPRSLAAVGRAWGVSREAARYWRNAALVLLRLPAFSGHLRHMREQDSRAAYARSQALSRTWQRQQRPGRQRRGRR